MMTMKAITPTATRLEKLRSPRENGKPPWPLGAAGDGGGGDINGGFGGEWGTRHVSETRSTSTPSTLKEKLGCACSGVKT